MHYIGIYKMTFYDLSMNNKKIKLCAEPTISTDVATKNYVDTTGVASISAGTNITITGTTTPTVALTNPITTQIDMGANKITNCADPANAQDVATKNYVDTRPLTYIISSPFIGTQVQDETKTYNVLPAGMTMIQGYWLVIGQVQVTANTPYNKNGHSNAFFRINFYDTTSTIINSTQYSGTCTNTDVNSVSSYVGLCNGDTTGSFLNLSQLIQLTSTSTSQKFEIFTGDLHAGGTYYFNMTFQAVFISP